MLIEQGKMANAPGDWTFATYGNDDFGDLYYVIKLTDETQFFVYRSLKQFDDFKELEEDMSQAVRSYPSKFNYLDSVEVWLDRYSFTEVNFSMR